MTKFRKKPTIIDAIQFNGENINDVKAFLDFNTVIQYDKSFLIKTLEGNMRVSPGDWVIKGVLGEFYPCKDEIFKLIYEEVKEGVYFQPDYTDVNTKKEYPGGSVSFLDYLESQGEIE